MSYASEVLADSPLLYWKLDEAGFTDSGSNGAAFTPGAGAVLGKAPLVADGGYAVSGSGSAPIASLPSVPTSLVAGNVTLEAWVTIPSTNVSGPFVKVGTSSNGWGVGVGGGHWVGAGRELVLLSEGVAWHPTSYMFGTGTYHVVAVRGAGGAVTAYVNGASVWTGTLSATNAAGIVGVGGIGSAAYGPLSSTVDVDNVAIYASALTEARVSAHYNSGSGSNAAIAADAPVVWLKLDDTTATLHPLDSSGNSRHGVHNGSPSMTQPSLLGDGSGYSVVYDGADDFSSITHAAWMDATTLTVEARIKPTAAALSGDQFIASRWGGASGTWLFNLNAGRVRATVRAGGVDYTATGTTALTADTAQTVGFRFDGSSLTVFLDGVADATVSVPSALMQTTVALEVARAAAALYGQLQIDEFSVTGSPLSNARMLQRHEAAEGDGTGATPLTATLTGQADLTAAASVTARLAAALAADTTLTADLGLVGKVPLAAALAADVTLAANLTAIGAPIELSATLAGDSSLSADLRRIAIIGTDATYANDGYNYDGTADVEFEPPIDPTPAHIRRAKVMQVHQSMSPPNLVNGVPR